MSKLDSIPDIHFSNSRSQSLGLEILPLESLFARGLNSVLESPQRVQFYHIFVFTHGAGRHSIDFTPYEYNDATLLLVSKGQVQQFEVRPETRGFLIVFTAEFMYENATELNVAQSLRVFEHALYSSPCIHMSADQQWLMHRLAQIIYHEYQKPRDNLYNEILRHFLRLIMLQTERILEANAIRLRAAPRYRELVAFRRLVEREMATSRSVQYYARQLAVSPKKLNELTQQSLNVSAKDFIEEQVVLESQRLLAQGNVSVKEIAFRLGFHDPTNWTKFFKKHTNVTPAAFRSRYHASD